MRETDRLNVPSYLPTLLGTGSPGPSLLAALHQFESDGPSIADPIVALEEARSGESRQVEAVAAEARFKSDMARFASVLGSADNPAGLLADDVALKVLLTANGLADQIGNPLLARQALLSDATEPDALVNKLTDARWLRVNNLYSFATEGLLLLQTAAALSAISGGYAAGLWRASLDRTTPGLSSALDFTHRASTISSAGQVLGDPTFRMVITTALGLPRQMAVQGVSAQEQAIAMGVDLAKFQDPAFVTQFAQRYLIATRDAAKPAENGAVPSLASPGAASESLII